MSKVLVLFFSGSELRLPVTDDTASDFAAAAEAFWGGQEKSKHVVVHVQDAPDVHVNLGRVCAFRVKKAARGMF